jgi:para-aminobenzoate synthetase/4-amino-4-deoxychorismate lyase
VFETMLVRDGRIQALTHHLDRLGRSVAALYGRRLPPGLPDRLRAHTGATTGEHRLRIDVVPDEDLAVAVTPVGSATRRAVTLAPLVVPGGLGEHKWRDRRLLDARPADPVPLLVDSDGTVLEGAWGNVWILEGDRLLTPPTDGRILPGVTRALLLALAPALGYHADETSIALDRARRAPVMFMTSAIRLAVAAGLADRSAPPPAAVDRIRAALAAHW